MACWCGHVKAFSSRDPLRTWHRPREAQCGLLAALRHPNVVQFMGVSAMPPAMITEYCSRGSLADVLHAATRSSARAAQLTWARRLNLVSCQGWGLQGRGQGQEGHA